MTTVLVQLLIAAVFASKFRSTETTILKTQLGYLEGIVDDFHGKGLVYRFLKIPYAKPPLGNLRFRKPLPYGNWSSTLNGKSFGPMCPQPNISIGYQSEDCLHLNIYIPHHITPRTRRSVMVWIHGGGYFQGSAIDYDGRDFVLGGDIILVTINYRIGILGFLATDDGSIPGNYGLWDQHLALQWVHNNIADYGGDPDSVTIFGESAGGGSVSFQSLYPGNKGLFQRVIAQSGVATSAGMRKNDPTNAANRGKTMKYIRLMNCSSNDIAKSLDCLRHVPLQDLYRLYLEFNFSMPAIDMDFVKGYAEDILANKSSDVYEFFTSLDYMVGALDGDGFVVLNYFLTSEVLNRYNTTREKGLSTEILCQYIPYIVNIFVSAPANKICEMYNKSGSIQEQINAIADIFTDSLFSFPAVESAEYHYRNKETNASTFVYLMTLVSPLQNIVASAWTPQWAQRATHGMDVLYLFNGWIYGNVSLNQSADVSLMKSMRAYWTNFAKTG